VSGVLVDSDVLLDVLTEDPRWFEWSSEALALLGEERVLTINPVIYSELSVAFGRVEDLEAVLHPAIRREPVPWPAAFLAGRCRHEARRSGAAVRDADLYIGAHAAIRRYTLLTRHPGCYLPHFPRLDLHAPAGRGQESRGESEPAREAAEPGLLRQLNLALRRQA